MAQNTKLLDVIVDEKQHLRLSLAENVEVRRMRHSEYLYVCIVSLFNFGRMFPGDVKTATKAVTEAEIDDPLMIYMHDTPDARDTRFNRWINRFRYALGMHQWVLRNMGLVVDNGHALVCNQPAPEADKRSKFDQLLDKLFRLADKALVAVGQTKQQRRRLAEAHATLDRFVEEMLGADAPKMRAVNSLVTAEAFRRRGYGGALVDAITHMADAEGRSTYLLSSNPINTEFYNAHGFFSLAEVLIGENDPTWEKPPISIPLVRLCVVPFKDCLLIGVF
ncbi:hypothetical protein DFH11DRAFT_1568845, partial [Phellopilus nigrolimitatus]